MEIFKISTNGKWLAIYKLYNSKITFIHTYRILDALGTVDYLDLTDGTVVFRTCDKEKDKVVVQLGTCDPQRALKVAKMM